MAGNLATLIIILLLSGTGRGQASALSHQDSLPFYGSQSAFSQGKLDEALDLCEKYYEQASQRKEPDEIFQSLAGIFSVYRQKGDYDKGFFYARQLYEISAATGNDQWLSVSLWCLAELYSLEGNYADALTYYRKAALLPHPETKGMDPGVQLEMQMAEVFSQLHQFDSAWYYYHRLTVTRTDRSAYLISTGECYFLQGNFQQALTSFRSGLGGYDKVHAVNGLMRTLPDIAKTYLAADDAKTALQFGRSGLVLALDSRANRYIRDGYKVLSEAFSRLGMMDSSNYYFYRYTLLKDAMLNDVVKAKFAAYGFEEKIARVDKENQLQAAELQREALLKKILLGCLLVLSILAFAFFRITKLKRKNEERMRQLAENELRIQKLESEGAQARFLQQNSDLELKALRARMDPHFIFNCLNSINRFIIHSDTERAADYLTKFARLMRMVLESSGKSFIPLEEELNILQLYVSLENLRFERPFIYEIDSDGIDASSVLIPSLLIQPFVENAIWHGLYPRTDVPGKIRINLQLDQELLYCEILDNGIGRKQSTTMKPGTPAPNRDPLGIALTTQRLERIDPLRTSSTGVSIEDMTDEKGNNMGTRVLLKIPVKFI